MLRAAARRLVVLLAVATGATAGISLLIGLAIGADVLRSVSTGLYLVGSFLLVAGFFVGNRGPARPTDSEDGGGAVAGMFGLGIAARGVRWATREERDEAIASSALFVTLGFLLIVIGFVADDRVRLI